MRVQNSALEGRAAEGARAVCPTCLVRFAGMAACPRCGATELWATVRDRRAIRSLATRHRVDHELAKLGENDGYLAAATSLFAITSGVFLAQPLTTTGIVAGVAAAALGIPGGLATKRLASRLFERVRTQLERDREDRVVMPVIVPALPPALDVVVGHVACDAPIASPLSGAPVVATRLVGRVGHDEVNDVVATSFDVVRSDGTACRVESGSIVLERDVPARQSARRTSSLEAFFERHGLSSSAPAELAEASIAPGDRVEVSGVLRGSDATFRGLSQERFEGPVLVRGLA